ncbi:hypothetical protein VTK26DRAFT_4276 [Humicola hyalothermophila]
MLLYLSQLTDMETPLPQPNYSTLSKKQYRTVTASHPSPTPHSSSLTSSLTHPITAPDCYISKHGKQRKGE